MSNSPEQLRPGAAPDSFAGGEMGERIRAFDWAQTPLGPAESWPQSLKTTVRLMLSSRYPMFIWWGPELTKIYNDAYILALGKRHPQALGRPAPEVWSDIWGTVGPQADLVLNEGRTTWNEELLLLMERYGYTEETYFTFSYSPVPNDAGGVGGVFCVCMEDTGRVLGKRRLKTLSDLGERSLAEAKTVEQACHAAAVTLAENPHDCPFTLIYVLDEEGERARLCEAVNLSAGSKASPLTLSLGSDDDVWSFRRVIETGQVQIIENLEERFGRLPAPPWADDWTKRALVLPLARAGVQELPAGFLVAGVSPRLEFNDDYRSFFDLVAGQIATAIANFRAYEEERRRAEALAELDREATWALRESEDRLQLALQAGRMIAWEWDVAQNRVTTSDLFETIYGAAPLEIAEEGWQLLHPEDQVRHQGIVQHTAAHGGTYHSEFRILRPDNGETVWIEEWCLTVTDEANATRKMTGVSMDITVRKRAEEALRERERSLSTLISNLPGFVFRCLNDETWNMVFISEGVREMTGYAAADFLERRVTWDSLVHPEDVDRVRADAAGHIEQRTPIRITYRILTADGQVRWVWDRATPVFAAPDEVVYWEGFVTDVTERIQAETALREADRRKDEFLAMLAHELRNPLAPIRNAAQVLRLVGPADASQQWAREVIERQTQHLTRLVDDLLDVSRITQGKVKLAREPLDLSTILYRAVEASRPLIDGRRHQLTVTAPSEPVRLEGDLTRLVQVVGNLLNNAAKYTDEGGDIQIEAAKEGAEAVIRVRDNGMGLPADLLPHVFDLFTQADRSLDRSQGGLGIGLTLVRQLVELHGGRVEARSAGFGQGSEFTVRLPAAASTTATSAQATAGEAALSASRALKILVVEDNADSAEMMSFLLKLGGHEVRTARDGLEALEAARAFEPQAVLCDIGLPGMNGYEVAERLRQQPAFQQTPLIALTGYGEEDARRRSREAGFDYHLVKPVEPDALDALLDSLR